jgi:MFS family permease
VNPIASKPAPPAFLVRVFLLEALGSVGANLMQYGIFFYMQKRFGWGARQNLVLSSAQGMVYVVGALASTPLAHKFDRQKLLCLSTIVLIACTIIAVYVPTPAVIVVLLLAYVIASAAQWPLLESLISIGADSDQLSRRISIYNLVWSGTGAVTVAGCGVIIARSQNGIFWAAAAAHVVALLLLIRIRPQAQHAHAHMDPEPELIQSRELAKRLSRIALPATFAVIYAMGAIMPTLPVIQSTSPELRTLVAGIWMIARWISFVSLGATIWWHTRPRALLIAAIIMLATFLGITLVPQLLCMVLCQIAMGLAMGLIYSASLYFGMVLSDGSTAQGSYHEALIGAGAILGPGCGALASILQPDNPRASIYAVGAILWLSVMAACAASLRTRSSVPHHLPLRE